MLYNHLKCKPTDAKIPFISQVMSVSAVHRRQKHPKPKGAQRESQETGRGRAKVKESKGQGCHATY